MVPVAPPILVFGDDLYTFRSVDTMLTYIEPIDARSVRAVFDASGQRFVLRTDGVTAQGRWLGGGRVRVECDSPSADTGTLDETLRAELSTRYRHFGFTEQSVAEMDLAALVAAAVRLTTCE